MLYPPALALATPLGAGASPPLHNQGETDERNAENAELHDEAPPCSKEPHDQRAEEHAQPPPSGPGR